MPRNAGRIIEKPNGSSLVALTAPSSPTSSTVILPVLDLLDPRAGHPLDVVVAHLALEQALGVADAVEAEVADIGFGGDEGHRHLVADLAAAQLRLEDEGELVGRAEARGALRRADHHRAGVLAEGLELGRRLLGMVDVADRCGEAVGAETLDLVEGQFRPGRDDQIVVADRRSVGRLDACSPSATASSPGSA